MANKIKFKKKYQEGTSETKPITFGKKPGVGRVVGKLLTGFADDKGQGYSVSPSEVLKNLATPLSLLSSCTVDKRVGYHPQKNPNRKGSSSGHRCSGPKKY